MQPRLDLNADVGESFGAYVLGDDEGILRSVTSASIACGFHAGDPSVMRRTLRLAREAGVAVGAHPGFPDLAGFGRRELHASAAEVEDLVAYQIGALAGIASAEGLALQHVKPHGALFNMAAADPVLAAAVARGVCSIDPRLRLFGPPSSSLLAEGRQAGLRVVAEGFADRAYEPDGSLVSRRNPDAVIHDVDKVIARAVRLATEGRVVARDGTIVSMRVDTLCVHGDTPGAVMLAARLRASLQGAGVRVAAVGADPDR